MQFDPDICGVNDSKQGRMTPFVCKNSPDNLERNFEGDSSIKVNLDLNYRPNPHAQLAHRIQRDEALIREDVQLMKQVREFINQIRQPFGFLKYNAQ